MPEPPGRSSAGLVVAVVLSLASLVVGCDAFRGTPPPAKPGDFADLRLALSQEGIYPSEAVSGDDGCSDATLAPTAIAFSASGLGVPTSAPVRLRVYLFRDLAAYERRRPDVDTCAAAWATDASSFEFVDAPPFVLAGQGPWPAAFKDALRAALDEANGD